MTNYLTAAGGAIGAAVGVVQRITTTMTAVAINDVKIELQGSLLAAQSALFQAQQNEATTATRISDLEKELVRLRDWSAEASRYEMKAIDIGAFAYMPKPGVENGEPPHWLCTNCFGKGQKSVLQTKGQAQSAGGGRGQYARWVCNACHGEVQVYYTRKPSEPWPKPTETDAVA